MASREKRRITITIAARRTGMSAGLVRRCVRRELVSPELTDGELARLRRIRRLLALGINLTGIEIILRMRQRIVALEDEVARLRKDRDGGNG